jgi:hypothetical protein
VWALLSTRLRTWLLLAIALPLVRMIVHRLSAAADRRDPKATTSKLIRHADTALASTSRRRKR